MPLEAMYYDGTYDSAYILCRWANDNGHCRAEIPEGCEDDGEPLITFVTENLKVVDITVLATNNDEPTPIVAGAYIIRQEDGLLTVCLPDPSMF